MASTSTTVLCLGRAGRVRAGHCWRLFSEAFFLSTRVDEHPQPEIQRVPLEEVVLQVGIACSYVHLCGALVLDAYPVLYVYLSVCVLQVLLLKLGSPESFLGQCMEPPSREQVRASLAVLIEVGAVLPLPALPLTALGYHLARMPVDVRIGKTLLYASLLQVSYCNVWCY